MGLAKWVGRTLNVGVRFGAVVRHAAFHSVEAVRVVTNLPISLSLTRSRLLLVFGPSTSGCVPKDKSESSGNSSVVDWITTFS